MTLPVVIDACSADDLAKWSRMRASLWPDVDAEGHRIEAEEILTTPDRFVAFIARDTHGVPLGFAEGSLRVD